ncbi:MAG: response regulator [Acidobacteria bacterium]|mgnify:CR=1 FL=1|nr:response regulator [Acidobacteriota bacterium]
MSIQPRVLIVDDEAALRRQVMVGLAQHGFEVDECEEGLSALSKIKAAESRRNPFGCVVLDLRLPDIDGLKILSVLKSIYSELPVVVITGYGNDDTINAVHSHGGSTYLDKPFEMDELVARIKDLVPSGAVRPEPKAAEEPNEQASGLVFIRGEKEADLPEMFSKLYYADGVCYCDPVVGDWDIVLLVQAHNRQDLQRLVEGHMKSLEGVQRYELHCSEKPAIPRELEEFIQDYEKVQAMNEEGGGAAGGRSLRKTASYAILDVDPAKLSSLYMKLYFTDNVVHCDVTDGGKHIILLLEGASTQQIQNTIRSEIRLIPGILRIKQLNTLNFSSK